MHFTTGLERPIAILDPSGWPTFSFAERDIELAQEIVRNLNTATREDQAA